MRRRYSIHGVGVAVEADPRILRAIDARLAAFAAPDVGGFDAPPTRPASTDRRDADVRFAFFEVAEADHPRVDVRSGHLRTIYDSENGEVVFDDRADRLHMRLANHIRVVCDPVAGDAVVTFEHLRGPDLWLLSHPALTLPLIEMLKRRGLYSLHAAGVSRAGRCLLMAGSSGAGKTTLGLALVRAGCRLLGDDMLFISASGASPRVHAFPDEVDISRQTAEFFPELRTLLDQPRRAGWPKWSFRAERMYSKVDSEWTGVPAAIILPRITRLETSRLEALSADEALLELVPNVLLTEPHACQAHLSILAQLVGGTACYRLWTGCDFDAIPNLLQPLLT